MTHRILLIAAGFLLLGQFSSAAERPPNIVFILADDLGYGDVGCFNPDSKIATPHLDQLAAQGIRFTDAHSPGAWCTPTRYGLLTGHYPWRDRRAYDIGVIAPERETLATLLKRHGYRTAMIGKWHLGFIGGVGASRDFTQPLRGGPIDHGFDSFFGMHASLDIPPYFFIQDDHAVAAPTDDIAAHHSPDVTEIQGEFWREGKIAPGFKHAEVLRTYEQKACAFVAEQAAKSPDQPFFLYLALTAPHTPWLPDAQYTGTSKCGEYGDFVQEVDAVSGQVLSALEKAGVAGKTLVLFSSDNGPVWYPQDVARYGHRAAGALRGMKDDMWEGGHRMPFIARWPQHIPAGAASGGLLCFTDMMATFAAILGDKLPPNAGEDSVNMLPLFLGQTPSQPLRQTLIIDGRMIRKGPWKYVQGKPQGALGKFCGDPNYICKDRDVLYNLKEDPREEHDVRTQHPKIAAELADILKKEKGTKR